MLVKLFDISNNKVVPTEHCYTLKFLKAIMDKYPDTYLDVYMYLFYMTCPDPDLNPFFNVPEVDKEEVVKVTSRIRKALKSKKYNLKKALTVSLIWRMTD